MTLAFHTDMAPSTRVSDAGKGSPLAKEGRVYPLSASAAPRTDLEACNDSSRRIPSGCKKENVRRGEEEGRQGPTQGYRQKIVEKEVVLVDLRTR